MGLAGQSLRGDKGVRENTFCKTSANRSIMSALLVAIVCFGRGRRVRGFVEIKIFDQNLTLLKMILKFFLVISQTKILLYKPVLVCFLCIRFSQTHVS